MAKSNTMQSNVELIVVKNAMDYATNSALCERLQGADLFELVKQAYPKGQPLNTRWYHGKWDTDCDVTPSDGADIEQLSKKGGVFYIVTYPADPVTAIIVGVSVLVSVAVAFLMPIPSVPTSASNQPPSPNNALARRVNRERLGGRAADIFGEVWSVPDLVAVTYTVWIDGREVEMSYMIIGRGSYIVSKALDDTTPIDQVFGSTVLVFGENDTLDSHPQYQFGTAFTPNEAEFSRLAVKRYTSVNGQILPPTDNYLTLDKAVFRAGGIIEQSGFNFNSQFRVGDTLTVVQPKAAKSANGITLPPTDPDGQPADVTYNLAGAYEIAALSADRITLKDTGIINQDWQKLTASADYTEATEATISTQSGSLWQGWFYSNDLDHEFTMVNIVAPNGLFITNGETFEPIGIEVEIESELVDVTGNPIAGTTELQTCIVYGSAYKKYATNNGQGAFRDGNHWWSGAKTTNSDAAQSTGTTVVIQNSHMARGKRLRWRASGKHNKIMLGKEFAVQQEVRIADFYGARLMTAKDAPNGFTKVYSKSVGTEGALSLKERKLKLLATRLVKDWRNNDALIASKRIDDIIYHIATDPVTSNLTASDLDLAQISAEVDAQIAHFGTDLCAQFCGTFDTTDITTEEMIQTVAKAGFFTAYRLNNQVHLHFERAEPMSVAAFNSHSILPDTFEYAESFGSRNNFDGIDATYIDPTDDAQLTLHYPASQTALNSDKLELVGVRNKVQAHMHMMRAHWKNQLAYSTCEFTGADESGIVIPTNRINVANQNNADTQQGAVEAIDVINGQTILTLSDSVDFNGKAQGTIFVQTVSGVVDNIRCYPRDDYSVVLSRAPSQPISTAWDAVVRATYQLVTHDDLQRDSYIVTAKDVGENPLSHKLTCINYDSRYYQNDKDYINGLIV